MLKQVGLVLGLAACAGSPSAVPSAAVPVEVTATDRAGVESQLTAALNVAGVKKPYVNYRMRDGRLLIRAQSSSSVYGVDETFKDVLRTVDSSGVKWSEAKVVAFTDGVDKYGGDVDLDVAWATFSSVEVGKVKDWVDVRPSMLASSYHLTDYVDR